MKKFNPNIFEIVGFLFAISYFIQVFKHTDIQTRNHISECMLMFYILGFLDRIKDRLVNIEKKLEK